MADPTLIKWCPTCQEDKPITEFHRNRSKPDGHSHQCKDCFRVAHKVYRQTPRGKATLAHARTYPATKKTKRRYDKSEKGRISHKRYRQTPQGKLRALCGVRKWQAANPEKARAHWRIHDLVRRGKMPAPDNCSCTGCGKPATQYHHHNGYDAAHIEDVIPVCAKCHAVLDNRIVYT